MAHLGLVLLVFAFVLAVIAACLVQTAGRFHLGWAALAFYFAALIVGGIAKVF